MHLDSTPPASADPLPGIAIELVVATVGTVLGAGVLAWIAWVAWRRRTTRAQEAAVGKARGRFPHPFEFDLTRTFLPLSSIDSVRTAVENVPRRAPHKIVPGYSFLASMVHNWDDLPDLARQLEVFIEKSGWKGLDLIRLRAALARMAGDPPQYWGGGYGAPPGSFLEDYGLDPDLAALCGADPDLQGELYRYWLCRREMEHDRAGFMCAVDVFAKRDFEIFQARRGYERFPLFPWFGRGVRATWQRWRAPKQAERAAIEQVEEWKNYRG